MRLPQPQLPLPAAGPASASSFCTMVEVAAAAARWHRDPCSCYSHVLRMDLTLAGLQAPRLPVSQRLPAVDARLPMQEVLGLVSDDRLWTPKSNIILGLWLGQRAGVPVANMEIPVILLFCSLTAVLQVRSRHMVRPATQARRFALVPSPLQTDLSTGKSSAGHVVIGHDAPHPSPSLAALLSPTASRPLREFGR
ncbi:hypothetical protein V8C35DRAFT_286953 [Trichoderma chlorosporum]